MRGGVLDRQVGDSPNGRFPTPAWLECYNVTLGMAVEPSSPSAQAVMVAAPKPWQICTPPRRAILAPTAGSAYCSISIATGTEECALPARQSHYGPATTS